jgi:DNA-binding HxlR family transcriptional regulator
MALLDLLGRRWLLRLVWELRAEPLTFRALQERCGRLSPTVLNRRLADLREAAIVELGSSGYALTKEGEQLLRGLAPLELWARRWARRS